jgi:predicted transcriptional regulator
MVLSPKALFSLTAADLMSAPLVTIPDEMSLRGAAHRLVQAAVTGAPVVNCEGRCVGVLSTTDFVHWMDRDHRHGPAACATSPAFCAPWTMVDPDSLPDEVVHDWMTRDAIMVTSAAPLQEVVGKMIDAHIHRVIVTDTSGRPVGIVTSTDVLAAVARAAPVQAGANAGVALEETVSC